MSDVDKGSATDDDTKNIDQNGAGSAGDDKGGKGESEHDIKKVNVEDLPPETQKIVKGFQASYTKEKQALKAKEDEVNELAKEAQTWKDWATKEQPKINEYNEWKKQQAEKGSANDGDADGDNDGDDDNDDVVADPKKYRKMAKDEADKVRGELDQKYSNTAGMIVHLMKVQQDNPDFKIDPQRVIDYATENNIPDIEKAFRGSYSEEIMQKKIDTAVAEKETELKNKYETKVHDLSLPGRTPRKVIKAKTR